MKTFIALITAALMWPAYHASSEREAPLPMDGPVADVPVFPPLTAAAPLPPMPIPAETLGAVAYELEGDAVSPDHGRVAVRARLMIAPMPAPSGDVTARGPIYLFPAWIEMNAGDIHVRGRNALGAVLDNGDLHFPQFTADIGGGSGFVVLTLQGGAFNEVTLEDDLSNLEMLVTTMPFKLERSGPDHVTYLGDFRAIRRLSPAVSPAS